MCVCVCLCVCHHISSEMNWTDLDQYSMWVYVLNVMNLLEAYLRDPPSDYYSGRMWTFLALTGECPNVIAYVSHKQENIFNIQFDLICQKIATFRPLTN